MTIFGTSGIRGPVGDTVTGALALGLGRALGSLYDTAVVGRDARESGGALARAAIAGVQEAGGDVVDVGVESTPTVARSVAQYDADAGLVVTASHNPPADNGFKFWTRSGQAFGPELNRQLTDRVDDSSAVTVPPAEMGSVRRVGDAARCHLAQLPDGDLDPLSVVVDVGNGTGRLTADALVDRGCDVTTVDAQRDGSFPGRPSEPTPENCAVVAGVVADTDADLGIAHDGDADRLVAVDERGAFVTGDELLATFATESVTPGAAVAVPINASGLSTPSLRQRAGRSSEPRSATATSRRRVPSPGSPSAANPAARGSGPRRRSHPTPTTPRAGSRRSSPTGDWPSGSATSPSSSRSASRSGVLRGQRRSRRSNRRSRRRTTG